MSFLFVCIGSFECENLDPSTAVIHINSLLIPTNVLYIFSNTINVIYSITLQRAYQLNKYVIITALFLITYDKKYFLFNGTVLVTIHFGGDFS